MKCSGFLEIARGSTEPYATHVFQRFGTQGSYTTNFKILAFYGNELFLSFHKNQKLHWSSYCSWNCDKSNWSPNHSLRTGPIEAGMSWWEEWEVAGLASAVRKQRRWMTALSSLLVFWISPGPQPMFSVSFHTSVKPLWNRTQRCTERSVSWAILSLIKVTMNVNHYTPL